MDKQAASTSRAGNAKLSSNKKRIASRKKYNNVSKRCIKRLARRGGVKRISGTIYEEARSILRLFLSGLIKDCCEYCVYFKRKTVLAEDVIRSMKNRGQRLYGFDEKPFPVTVRSSARLTDDRESTAESSVSTIWETGGSSLPNDSHATRSKASKQDNLSKATQDRSSEESTVSNICEAGGSSSLPNNTPVTRSKASKQVSRPEAKKKSNAVSSSPSLISTLLGEDSDSSLEDLPTLKERLRNTSNSCKSVEIIDLDHDLPTP